MVRLSLRPVRWAALPVNASCVVLLILALTTSALQSATAADWADYLVALRATLRGIAGGVTWENTMRTLPADEVSLFVRMKRG